MATETKKKWFQTRAVADREEGVSRFSLALQEAGNIRSDTLTDLIVTGPDHRSELYRHSAELSQR